jgi:regulator of replication initiation timing
MSQSEESNTVTDNTIVTDDTIVNDNEISRENLIKMYESITEPLNEVIQIVCRQTELTEEEAKIRLEKEQYNYMKVLNDYFGIKDTSKNKNRMSTLSTNQQIYGEIRNLMDSGARSFRKEQEKVELLTNVFGK